MEPKYLTLIIIVAFFFVLLLIFGILSLVYQKKHQGYVEFRNHYFQQYQQAQSGTYVLPQPLTTTLVLPEDEQLYLVKPKVNYFLKKGKFAKSKRQQIVYDYERDYDIFEAKQNYSLRQGFSKKLNQKNVNANLYVTNKQILLKGQKDLVTIKFCQIEKIVPEIIADKKHYFIGIIIYKEHESYHLYDDSLEDLLLLQALLKGKDPLHE
jgi:hypothetical protein